MAVYVDELLGCLPRPMWPWKTACHMFADEETELHVFAARIGLKRNWFQQHPVISHYDLTPNKRQQAIRAGAIAVTRQEVYNRMQRIRREIDQEGAALGE
jgi:hypothetical protein